MPRDDATRSGESRTPDGGLLFRVAWMAGAGALLFVATALLTFNIADAPSHLVAIHSDPSANLCGPVGSHIAWWLYYSLGYGVWIMLLGTGNWLWAGMHGRPVSQPLTRCTGLLLTTLGLSGLHGLVAPELGAFAGTNAGWIPAFILDQCTPRFGSFGTSLVLLTAIGLGLVVAFDQLLWSLPHRLAVVVRWLVQVPRLAGTSVGHLLSRPQPVPVGGGPELYADGMGDDEEWEWDTDTGAAGIEDNEAEGEADATALEDADENETPPRGSRGLFGLRGKRARSTGDPPEEQYDNYQFPGIDLLEDAEEGFGDNHDSAIKEQALHLQNALELYGIEADIVDMACGPTVTVYSVRLAPGTKRSKVKALAEDLQSEMGAESIRIIPTVAGTNAIGIEVPNPKREIVRLKQLLHCKKAGSMHLPMFLGKDSSGEPLVADLTRMPHMLIAGTTGAGKSVCMNSILLSWLYTKRPDELKLVLFDPKMVEMSQFKDIPHLLCPVVTESERAASIMNWAVQQMDQRYELLREAGVRDITTYNALGEKELYEVFDAQSDEERARIPKHMPYIVFVVDELADLMMTCKDVEPAIVRIAQKARAVGIHLILATQRPEARVVTGLIKANMPCRVSFKVASGMESRIVLDMKGAEVLLSRGDMLFLQPGKTVRRAQCTFISTAEARLVTQYLREISVPNYERSLLSISSQNVSGDIPGDPGGRDPLFDEATGIIIESGRGSVSLLQRRLAIGYGRASRLVDQICDAGIIGDHKGSVAREVLVTLEEWESMKTRQERDRRRSTIHANANYDNIENATVPDEYDSEYLE